MNKFLIAITILFLLSLGVRFCNKSQKTENYTSDQSYSCQKLHQNYLSPEVILNKESRKKGIKVLEARAVRSPDYKKFYFVQYKIEIPGEGIVYPMFAMNKPFDSTMGVIYSMDDLAVSLSGLGDARKTGAKFSQLDRGFSDAKKCLKK